MSQSLKPKKDYKLVKGLFGKYEEIPEDWEIMKINQLGKIVTGNTSTSIKEYYGNDHLWASPSDFGNKKFIENTNTKLSKKGFQDARILPKNSVLVVCIGSTIGKIGMAYEEMFTNQQINSIICNKEIHPDFVYYQLSKNNSIIRNFDGYWEIF